MSSSTAGYVSTPLTISTFYDYTPVLGILIAAAIIFGIQTAIVLFQSIRSRTWFLLWLVLFTAGECGGYVAYSVFRESPDLNSYLGQLILIILAPNFVTLVNYTVISRIIPWAGFDSKTFLARRGNLVPAVFLTSDLLCLILQGIGGSQLSASHHDGIVDENKFDIGKKLTLAGISAQLGFQTIFALLAVYVYVKMPNKQAKHELRWAWLCMLLTMVMVSIRNIYRIVEFAGGQHSAVDQTQVPYMVLDLLLMLLVGCVFIVLDLGSDWVLPERMRQAKLMDNATDVGAAGVSGQQRKAVDVEMGSKPHTPTMVSPAEDSV